MTDGTQKPMTDQELIELIQSQLPQDLTAKQIAQLRATMRTNPKVRDALWEELRFEQAIATQYVPESEMSADLMMNRIEQLLVGFHAQNL